MYVPMPSPRGTNRAGLFIPASRFGVFDVAYDAALSGSPEGEHPAHEVLRRARAALTAGGFRFCQSVS
jgi:hypothetical protein